MKLPKIELPVGTPSGSPDGNITARQNELAVLTRVREFGHLRISELARLVWYESANTASAVESARRTVRRLLHSGHLLERVNALGGRSFVLTKSGALRLQTQLDLQARDGYDIQGVSGGTFYHRTLSTVYLAERAAQGDTVWGEYALAKEWAPYTNEALEARFDKRPDGLIRLGTSELSSRGIRSAETQFFDVLETESTYKPDAELERVLALALRLDNERFDRLVIAFDAAAAHEKRIRRAWARLMARAKSHSPELDEHTLAQFVELARLHVAPPLRLVRLDRVTLDTVL